MRIIELTQGYKTLVDDADFERLSRYRWKVLKTRGFVYASRTIGSTGRTALMHREILGSDAPRIDHVDGNTLNNQRANLRGATASQNAANSFKVLRGRTPSEQKTSKFKGVYWNKKDRRWQAQIGNGKNKIRYLGQFKDEAAAACAYDRAALARFGQFAVVNAAQ